MAAIAHRTRRPGNRRRRRRGEIVSVDIEIDPRRTGTLVVSDIYRAQTVLPDDDDFIVTADEPAATSTTSVRDGDSGSGCSEITATGTEGSCPYLVRAV
jgi:hypothetical protein